MREHRFLIKIGEKTNKKEKLEKWQLERIILN